MLFAIDTRNPLHQEFVDLEGDDFQYLHIRCSPL